MIFRRGFVDGSSGNEPQRREGDKGRRIQKNLGLLCVFVVHIDMKALAFACKWTFAAFLPLLAWGFGRETLELLSRVSFSSPRWQAFLGGLIGFVPVWFLLRRRLAFFATLEHELTHLLVGLLCLKKPESLHATARDGGEVRIYTGKVNFLIGLAPYFLPTLSYCALPFPAIVQPRLELAVLVLMGATAAYHILSTIDELSVRQPDLREAGLFFSSLFLPVANLVSYGAILAFVDGGYGQTGSYLVDGVIASGEIVLRIE